MKVIQIGTMLLCCTVAANAALITVGDATGTDWSGTDLQTIGSSQGTTIYDLKDNNTAGLVQSFTATESMTVGTISILAQRLVAGMDFGVDVYEFLPGDGGSTYGANPDKFRLDDATRSTLLKSYSLNASTAITSGNPGENQFDIGLDAGEQFDVVAGNAYGVHIYSKVSGGTGDRLLVWNYANSDAYAGGTYGVPNSNVADRDLGLAITAIPEPAALGLIGMVVGMLLVVRRFKI